MIILLVIFYFSFPLLVIGLINKYEFLNKIGSIVLVYIVGIIMGNINLLPLNIFQTQDLITSITIPLAIPLLIFNFDVKRWLKLAKPTVYSLLITLSSVVLIVVISFFIFNDQSRDYWKIPGLLVGVYTGGTPNLAAIKTALNVDSETYLMIHTFDMVFSSIYLLFLMVFGRKFFGLFLPKYQSINLENESLVDERTFLHFYKKKSIKEYPLTLILAVLIFLNFSFIKPCSS